MRLLSALAALVASGPLVAATGMTLATLKSGFSGIVSQPGDAAYDITRYNVQAELPASFVIYPATPADVGKSLQFASSNGYDLALKSGGHGSSGASSSLNGVVIDMSKFFTNISVNAAAQTATVEVGVQVNQLEVATMVYGLAPVMGACSNVGLGGLITGAGLGLQVGVGGLSIDNVLSASMVLPNGTYLPVVDSNTHPDLFWAIRGGGSNFGVVLQWTLKLYPQAPLVHGCAFEFPTSLITDIVVVMNNWKAVMSSQEMGDVFLKVDPTSGQPYAQVIMNSITGSTQNLTTWTPILQLAAANNVPGACYNFPYTYASVSGASYGATIPGKLVIGAYVHHMTNASAQATVNVFTDMVTSNPRYNNTVWGWEIYNMEKVPQVASGDTAFFHRSLDWTMVGSILWSDGSPTIDAYPWALALNLAATIDQPDLWLDPGYVNYADVYANLPQALTSYTQLGQAVQQIGSRHPLLGLAVGALLGVMENGAELFFTKQLYGTNYNRLKGYKDQYDPSNILKHWFNLY